MRQYHLVFEGGGAKGVTFAGALEELFDAGCSPGRLIGTSAGAITAALLAAGYTPKEMLAAVTERLPTGEPRFTGFFDAADRQAFSARELRQSFVGGLFRSVNLPLLPESAEAQIDLWILALVLRIRLIRQLFSLVERGGFFRGHTFLAWLRERLAAKGLPPDIRFGAFAAKTGADLTVVASDTTGGEMLALNHRTTPNLPVAWAVRMSMSIPFVWEEVVWKAAWGRYRGLSLNGHTIVDGGALSNFPMRLLVEPNPDHCQIMGLRSPAEASPVLGLLIDDDAPLPPMPILNAPPGALSRLPTVARLGRLADTMMKAGDRAVIRRFERQICRLPAEGYGTLEFDLAGPRLARFVESGRLAMRNHLQQGLPAEC